jgi:hypothetical protein
MKQHELHLLNVLKQYALNGFNHMSPREYMTCPKERRAIEHMLSDDEEATTHQIPDRVSHYMLQDQLEHTNRLSSRYKNLAYYKHHLWSVTLTKSISVPKDDSHVPLSLHWRKARALCINDHDDSRLMYLYHDLIDHLLFFEECNTHGLFDRYETLFSDLDDPRKSYMFIRSSEHLSGVSFALRHFTFNTTRPLPPTATQIISTFLCEEYPSIPATLTQDYQDALAYLANEEHSNFITAVVLDVLVQIADERRVWGAAKHPVTSKPLSLISAPYVLFIVTCCVKSIKGLIPFREWCLRVACWSEHLVQQMNNSGGKVLHNFRLAEVFNDIYVKRHGDKIGKFLNLMTCY